MATVGENFTIGVEEEFLLVDPDSRRLVPRAERVLALARAGAGDGQQVDHELQQSQLETGTGVCRTAAELRGELVRLRRSAATAAEQVGCRLAAAGTHPLPFAREGQVTPEDAYLRLEREYQTVMREQMVCGCHVHVGLVDAEEAIEVLNRSRAWLPVVAALAVNSPFWLGEDTGYASFRAEIWRRWPISGMPDTFASRSEYDALVDDLLRTEAIDDPARIYWDVRPSARYDTLEFRVTDTCLTVDEAVMTAGLVQALVRTLHEQMSRGEPPVSVRPELLQAATWRAARYGTEGRLIDPTGRRSVSAADAVDDLLILVRPALEEAGSWDEVHDLVGRTLREGTGAMRQRRAFARAGRLSDVVDLVVAETARH
ncbi:MAG TPA: glutamate--cysteine ligase [Acidimicrobiales bacterium]|nr:glutamate--cysteine ligase [Acidimicrobiales bacterium]